MDTDAAALQDQLCLTCSNITLQKLLDVKVYNHLSRKDLIESASSCRLCSLFLDGLRKYYASEFSLSAQLGSPNSFDNYVPRFQGKPAHQNIEQERCVLLSLKPSPPPPISQRMHIRKPHLTALYFGWGERFDAGKAEKGRFFAGDMLSSSYLLMSASKGGWASELGVPVPSQATAEERFNQVRAWLDQDIKEMQSNITSNTLESRTVVPSRLIDVECFDPQEDTIKLVESEKIQETCNNLEWIALSHRWGNCQHLVTNKDTLEKHLAGIPFSNLPQTFRDAVIVTRKLSARYLWIDALCIFQDDADDWEKEAAIMGVVYQHSLCTIAAHSAVNDEGGFLNSALAVPEIIQLDGNHDRQKDALFLSPDIDFHSDVNNSELSRRGWVLQERLLPSRIIHFTPSHIYWESTGTLSTRSESNTVLSDDKYPSRPAIPRQLQQSEETPSMWFDTVERYTACGLTKASDKLIAISGLAKQIQCYTKVGYMAGIWHDQFNLGLLWARKGTTQRMPNSTSTRASTWSWASLDSPVAYPVAVSHHELGRQVTTFNLELKLATVIVDKGAEIQPPFINGPASLMLLVCSRPCFLSGKPNRGQISQRLPYIASIQEENSQQKTLVEPYADTAQRLGLGTLYGTEEEKAKLREHGLRMIYVIEDPQLNDDTDIRQIVDGSGNAVGWAVLDEEGDPAFSVPDEVGSVEVFLRFHCIKVASFHDQLGVRGTFVLIVKPKPDGKEGEWVRIGMGLVKGEWYFQEVALKFIFLC